MALPTIHVSPSPRVHFSAKIKFEWLKSEPNANVMPFLGEDEKINGTFVNGIPVGLFQLLNDKHKVIEEVIFIK